MAGGGGEHEAGVDPGRSGGEALLALAGAVCPQYGHGFGVERDDVFAAVGLGGFEAGGPAELGELPPDGELRGVEVDVAPVLPAGFASTQSAVGDQVVQGVPVVVGCGGVVEERPGLCRRPYHHGGGDLSGGLPPVD